MGTSSSPSSPAKRGAVTGLPNDCGPIYIVSGMVLDALSASGSKRNDVFAPDTGAGAVRDEAGRIVAVRRLVGVAS